MAKDRKHFDDMEPEAFFCACHSSEHQIIVAYDEELNCAYVEFHLIPATFFKRVKNAIKYIFGYRSKYGEFDEFIVDNKDADRIIELGTILKEGEKTEE